MELTDAVVQKLRSLSIRVFLPFFRVGNSTPCLQVKTIIIRSVTPWKNSLEPLCAKAVVA